MPWEDRTTLSRVLSAVVAGSILLAATAGLARAADPPRVAARVLTNIAEIWGIPRGEADKPHRIRTEVLVYFFDAEWGNAAGECGGKPVWLPIGDSPTRLKSGQRVAIDGLIIPRRERFLWDQTQIRVLEEGVPLLPETVAEPDRNPEALRNHLVSFEGMVDGHVFDPTHYKLMILRGNTPAMAHVMKGTGGTESPFQVGDFVRIKGVFVPQLDRNGKLSDLTLQVASPADVEVIGSLNTDPRFRLPITRSEEIQASTPSSELVHVEGIVREQDMGKWLTLWDSSGAVMVESKQSQPLRVGERVEAVGYPFVVGVQQCLQRGLYRRTVTTNSSPPEAVTAPGQAPLRLVAQIRALRPQEANRQLPVALRAVVTWAHTNVPFAYVQDASGGIRVAKPQWESAETAKPGTIVTLEGVTTEGDFVPVVTNAVLRRSGWWNLEPGRLVSLEEAQTGLEDGRWVEMRGFVRAVKRARGLVHFELSTSSGDFDAWAPATESFGHLKGSILRVQGVCAAVSNARRQLTGVQMWVPDSRYIRVEEAAPEDFLALPLRSLGDLRRYNLENELNRRVRTAGTVVLHVPGRHLYVQDGPDSVFALSLQNDRLQPGDRVEVVGFPVNEGRRFLLREAVYRKLEAGPEPLPVVLAGPFAVHLDYEGCLARVEGRLLDLVEKDGEARLLIQTEDLAFEANLASADAKGDGQRQILELGSRLAVTGVYEVRSDEYGQPRAFLMRLRSWSDVHLLQRPAWWTPVRLLWVLLAVLSVFLVALSWGLVVSRKNKLLKQAQAALQAANDRLEIRVGERTQELAGSLSLLTATLESTADGILVVDQHGRVTSHNTRFARMWGLPADLLEGRDDGRLLGYMAAQLKDGAGFLKNVRDLYAKPEAEGFAIIEFEDGRVFERCSQPQRLGGECVGRVWCFRDVTERRQAEVEREKLEAQNRQLQKSESLGRMAGAIAHHFNNQLQAVMMNLEMTIETLPRNAALAENLTAAMQSARKAAEVSSLMLTYLGQTVAKREPLELSEFCQRSLSLLRAVVPPSLVLQADLPSPGPVVEANPNQLQQVLTNMLTNAAEACAEGRGDIRLAVKTAAATSIPTRHRFPVDGKLHSETYACVEVVDAGCGIRDQDIEKIFDPFYSQKRTGRGMGLAAVLGIVRAHLGVVTVQSQPGRGSVFRVFLPVSTRAALPQPAPASAVPQSAAGGLLLVVEDEAVLRKALVHALRQSGFRVLAAADGVEAVEAFRQYQGEVACVMCDLTMPRMGGWETLAALRRLAPDLPVIMASGYGEAVAVADDQPHRPQAFLSKPYELDVLRETIARVTRNSKGPASSLSEN